mmetsp:Transcript_29103/g.29452  ORF Transcript_29103/g.29452 Transcript_29103/m.29452 type:complete len:223 (+) Transcript_29103:27-695(+)
MISKNSESIDIISNVFIRRPLLYLRKFNSPFMVDIMVSGIVVDKKLKDDKILIDDGTNVCIIESKNEFLNETCEIKLDRLTVGDLVDVFGKISVNINSPNIPLVQAASIHILSDPNYESLRILQMIEAHHQCYFNSSWTAQHLTSAHIHEQQPEKEVLEPQTACTVTSQDLYTIITKAQHGITVAEMAAVMHCEESVIHKPLETLRVEGSVYFDERQRFFVL